jgi:hypothetical protein
MIDNGSLRYYLAQPDLQGMKLHIVVSPPEFNVKISAIDVKSWTSPKTCHTHIIS